MVDPDIQSLTLKLAVGDRFPRLSDVAKLHVSGRHSVGQQPGVLVLEIGLLTEPLFTNLPRRHHHMRMAVSDIAFIVRRMDCEVDRSAIAVRQILRKDPRRR